MKAPLSVAVMVSGLAVFSAGLEAQSRFVYTNDDLSTGNTVSGFLDTNGALTPLPNSPFSTGGRGTGGGNIAANRIAIAGGKFLYASNGATANISAFSIDPNQGGLVPVPSSPYPVGATGFGDISLAASPDGLSLFAGVGANNTVVRFSINADGSLVSQASAMITAAFGQIGGMKVSADGNYLSIGLPAYNNFGAVAMFSIAGGTLTLVNGMAVPGTGTVAGVDINCASTNLFGGVMSQNPTQVDAYSIGSNGWLSRIQGSPFAPGVGANSSIVALSPDDKHLFVSNQLSQSVTAFNVDPSTGALTLVSGSPFSAPGTGTHPAGMATDQSGTTLYVASNPNLIYVFSIAADGSLAPVANSPFSTNQGGALLSLVAFPGKSCSTGPVGGPPPNPNPPPPVTPPPPPVTPPPPPSGPMAVKIEIRNGDDGDDKHGPAEINPKSHGKIRVSILSSKTFNAPAQVGMTSLTFGHSGSEKSLAFCETQRRDVNHDHIADLVCHFDTQKANFQKGDTMGILDGVLVDGKTTIQGTDSIRIAH
jgi:6-phosphogluconolactonase (cycloisomerase 2 family)